MTIKTQKIKLVNLVIVLMLIAGGLAIQNWLGRPTADEPPTTNDEQNEQYDYRPVRNPRIITIIDSKDKGNPEDPNISLALVFDPPLDENGQLLQLDYQVSLRYQLDPYEPTLASRPDSDFDPMSHVEGGPYIEGLPDNFSIDPETDELPDFSGLPWYTDEGGLYLLNIGSSTQVTDDSIYTFKIQAIDPMINRLSEPIYVQISGNEILDAINQGGPITQLPAKVAYALDQLEDAR